METTSKPRFHLVQVFVTEKLLKVPIFVVQLEGFWIRHSPTWPDFRSRNNLFHGYLDPLVVDGVLQQLGSQHPSAHKTGQEEGYHCTGISWTSKI